MTTIACSLKRMAADSMVSDENTDIKLEKMTVVGGAIVGCTGAMPAASKFLEYIEGMGKVKRPRFGKDDAFEALVLTEEGLFWYDRTCRARPVTEGFCAIGSGTQAAMAKLREGGGPVAAVRHAIRADKNSAPPIRVLTLAALKRRKG